MILWEMKNMIERDSECVKIFFCIIFLNRLCTKYTSVIYMYSKPTKPDNQITLPKLIYKCTYQLLNQPKCNQSNRFVNQFIYVGYVVEKIKFFFFLLSLGASDFFPFWQILSRPRTRYVGSSPERSERPRVLITGLNLELRNLSVSFSIVIDFNYDWSSTKNQKLWLIIMNALNEKRSGFEFLVIKKIKVQACDRIWNPRGCHNI